MSCLLELILLPFRAAAWMIASILSIAGRMASFFIGLALCVAGVALCMTLVGAVAGVPMVIFGGGLMLRSIF